MIPAAHGQTQRLYDAAGKLTRSSVTTGTTTKEYDAAGRFIGESRR